MAFQKITESDSIYRDLEKKSSIEILKDINTEDKKVPVAIEKAIPSIEKLVEAIIDKMVTGGRLFYIGAGTSGRLGIVDASECPPTFGVPEGLIIGIIAGGNKAIWEAVESAEDDLIQGWEDLKQYNISSKDMVIGITASGTTPYVVGVLQKCRQNNVQTGSICCNPGAPLSLEADYPVEVVVGPEFVTGSTRMKGGTAQKLVLNMISTTVMIRLGRVEDNKMVHMQMTNDKLVDRGVKMLMENTGIPEYATARALLIQYGSVRLAMENYLSKKS